jgi:putative phosphoesterase
MRIGVVSDTHRNLRAVAEALRILEEREVGCILHCGDIDNAETVELFAGMRTHFILGNCDYDVAELQRAAKAIDASLHGRFADLELAGKRIALVHGDDKRLIKEMETSGRFDYLFYGHTHEPEEHRTGRTLVLNPGALYRARPKTFVILDLVTGKFERLAIGE